MDWKWITLRTHTQHDLASHLPKHPELRCKYTNCDATRPDARSASILADLVGVERCE
jgi:hypothetical protein